MKKVFLTIAMFGLTMMSLTSCKDKAKLDLSTIGSDTSEVTTDASESSPSDESAQATPGFSDPEVQAYVASYESHIQEYAKAVEDKDMEAFTALATKGQELGSRAQEVSGKLTGTDAELLTS